MPDALLARIIPANYHIIIFAIPDRNLGDSSGRVSVWTPNGGESSFGFRLDVEFGVQLQVSRGCNAKALGRQDYVKSPVPYRRYGKLEREREIRKEEGAGGEKSCWVVD